MRGGQKVSLFPSCPLTPPPPPAPGLPSQSGVRATISIFPSLHFFLIFLSSPSSRPSSSSCLPLISPPSYPVRPSIIGHQRIAGSKMRYYQNAFAFILGAVGMPISWSPVGFFVFILRFTNMPPFLGKNKFKKHARTGKRHRSTTIQCPITTVVR